ncbi:energy transducer TonB [Solirubrum puertoriconensis]|uniref:energy transducer TonB n=1 Tax=Solirubrum puertoriconensis TaxID=1751427 RepID=UPI00136667FA|nr:energy transducer TonB [Solirubrum puertoriconensis]
MRYTRTLRQTGGRYITVYRILHPRSGAPALLITATHNPIDKTIRVEIEAAGGGLFTHINTETLEYDEPPRGAFGFRGAVGALGGRAMPDQLAVQFLSAQHEHIKVLSVLGLHEDDHEFWVLEPASRVIGQARGRTNPVMERPSTAGYQSPPSTKLSPAPHRAEVDEPTPAAEYLESDPSYPGGSDGLRAFLRANIRYPDPARRAEVSGKVFVLLTIDTVGRVAEARVSKGLHPACDAEALRVTSLLEPFSPGRLRGKPVVAPYTLVVPFVPLGD